MQNSSLENGPESMQNGNSSFDQSWVAFFAQIKKMAAKLDELEQIGTEKS